MFLPAMTTLSSPQATSLLQKNAPAALMSTPSVLLGMCCPLTASVEMVIPVIVTSVSFLTQMCSSGGLMRRIPLTWTRVTCWRLTSCGRASDGVAVSAFHQAWPWPSIVPEPVRAMSCELAGQVMKAVLLGYVPYGSIFSVAPAESSSRVPLLMTIGPLRNVPAGTTTVPPPAAAAAVSAAWIAFVSSVLSSPTAPVLAMSNVPEPITGNGTVAGLLAPHGSVEPPVPPAPAFPAAPPVAEPPAAPPVPGFPAAPPLPPCPVPPEAPVPAAPELPALPPAQPRPEPPAPPRPTAPPVPFTPPLPAAVPA